MPALRWDRAHGFRYLDGRIDDALALGVGGFLIEGGPREEVAALAGRLHADSDIPILVAAPAERGAGQAIAGLTQLPPFGALASGAVVHPADGGPPSLDVDAVRRAARLTARELRNVGANWALAPVCELDVARGGVGSGASAAAGAQGSASIGSRGASGDAAVVAAVVSEWIDACQAEAVLACAMTFPGGADLHPFSAAIDAGVASVMVSLAAAPRLGAPEGAMLSAALVENVLRTQLHFEGLVSTIVLDREHGLDATRERTLAVSVVAAGCDVILAPSDLAGVADALQRAVSSGAITADRIREVTARFDQWSSWARPSEARQPSMDDLMWSRQVADRAIQVIRGPVPRVLALVEVTFIGALGEQDFTHFTGTLRALHAEVTTSTTPAPHESGPLVVVFSPEAADTGNVPRDEIDRVRYMTRLARQAGREVAVVACCHPRAAAALGDDCAVLAVWNAERPMQEAAARALAGVPSAG